MPVYSRNRLVEIADVFYGLGEFSGGGKEGQWKDSIIQLLS